MLKELDEYNWEEAFKYAESSYVESHDSCPTSSFSREDVTKIYGIFEGTNDEEPWRIYGKLKDKRYFYLEAGCDYTGWGCKESGRSTVSLTKKGIIKEGLTEEARRIFNLAEDNVGTIEIKGIKEVDTNIDYRKLLKKCMENWMNDEGGCWDGSEELNDNTPLSKLESKAFREVYNEVKQEWNKSV